MRFPLKEDDISDSIPPQILICGILETVMKQLWEIWKKVAESIGNFQTRIIFSALYFLIFSPVGVISSFFNDFLGTKRFPDWSNMQDNASTLKKLKAQY